MRIIKFNEFNKNDYDSWVDSLLNFCKRNLAHLLDFDFIVSIQDNRPVNTEPQVDRQYRPDVVKNQFFRRSSIVQSVKLVIEKDRSNQQNQEFGKFSTSFIWADVKDDIIPFLELINNKYELDPSSEGFVLEFTEEGLAKSYLYTFDDVVNNTGKFLQEGFNDDKDDWMAGCGIESIVLYLKQPELILK